MPPGPADAAHAAASRVLAHGSSSDPSSAPSSASRGLTIAEAAARRPRRRPGENRERLIEAGIDEFGTLGYHGASTASVAESAEVPQPHVYASFSTKRELFLASLERACAHLEQQHSQSSAEVSCRHALVVFQAVALVRDGELRAPLLQRISALREILGESAFSALLERAAAQLLDAPAPGR